MNTTYFLNNSAYSNLSSAKFHLKLTILKVFPVENRKGEYHHGILHIWINLGTKFQLKLIILSFWTKFTQKKGISSSKQNKQAVQGPQAFAFCVVKVNSTVCFYTFWRSQRCHYFEHFERKIGYVFPSGVFFILNLYKVFQTTVQIAMISKVMIKFRSKFQFQIPLQFYRTVEKVETCDSNDQKFWQVPPSFQPLVTILFFHDWDSSILNIKAL